MVIRLRKNGPIVIDDPDAQVVDWNGTAYPVDRRPIALCRCGGSSKKPFCDGSHARIGFQAPPAPEPAGDEPSKP